MVWPVKRMVRLAAAFSQNCKLEGMTYNCNSVSAMATQGRAMKRTTMPADYLRRLLGAALFCAASTCAVGAEQRIALIIGNSNYPTAPLRNPVNDATAMASKLQLLGFEVILKTNVTQREMNRAVVQFGQKLIAGSVGLFYYAGHGLQVRGKNFLVPVDAEIDNEASVRSES